MIEVGFTITGSVMLPEGTTTDGLRIFLPDGTVLGPAIVFEDEATGEDLTEGDISDKYHTDVHYQRVAEILEADE